MKKKENKTENKNNKTENKINKIFVINLNNIINLIFVIFLVNIIWNMSVSYLDKNKIKSISISDLSSRIESKEIKKIQVSDTNILSYDIKNNVNISTGTKSDITKAKYKTNKENNISILNILHEYGVASDTLNALDIEIVGDNNWLSVFTIFGTVLPILFFVIVIFMMTRGVKGGGMQALAFGNSRAKRIDPTDEKQKLKFSDVAGNKNAKQDLAEIVEFLKNPDKFLAIGATIPKGVLLTGRPGTGKTMLAKAVAGEAGVPFFYLSGSEFVEMFVGVGASRVRDLFNEAKKVSPCIIFIDEIDSIGRSRGIGTGGGNDEREQTLNQILVEMDGFESTEKVIVLAATNRPDVLDTALLRPGRFDRRVYIELPDRGERVEILRAHVKQKPLAADIDLDVVASRTPGFSGADLQSLMNEAAITAARDDRKSLEQKDILESIEKVLLGAERQSHLMNEEEKKIVAYHEAGHALVSSLLPHADPVQKISIISRGSAGGYTLKLPDRERHLHSKSHILDDIAMTYGGYAAETIVYGEVTTGPSNDIQVASNMARDMVRLYGMSESMGAIAYDGHATIGVADNKNNYSEATGLSLDNEIKKILDNAKDRAMMLVNDNRKLLDAIATELMRVENLERDAFEAILKTYGVKVKERVGV